MAIGAPTECDIEKRLGDTKDISILLKDSSGNVLDVSGYTALLTINTSKTPDISSSPEIGTEIFQTSGVAASSPGTDGILRFDFAAFGGSPYVQVGSYFYDVQITDVAGEIFTPLIGAFKVKQDITKN
jgi:hypothetical protein